MCEWCDERVWVGDVERRLSVWFKPDPIHWINCSIIREMWMKWYPHFTLWTPNKTKSSRPLPPSDWWDVASFCHKCNYVGIEPPLRFLSDYRRSHYRKTLSFCRQESLHMLCACAFTPCARNCSKYANLKVNVTFSDGVIDETPPPWLCWCTVMFII